VRVQPAVGAADQLGHLHSGRRAECRPSPPRSPSCPRRTGARSSAGTPPTAVCTGSSSVRATRPTARDRCCSSTASRWSAHRHRIPLTSRRCNTWRQGQEPACCPTGIATVRFKIDDVKLEALDPIPNP